MPAYSIQRFAAIIAVGKKHIPQYPCAHAQQQHFLYTDAVK